MNAEIRYCASCGGARTSQAVRCVCGQRRPEQGWSVQREEGSLDAALRLRLAGHLVLEEAYEVSGRRSAFRANLEGQGVRIVLFDLAPTDSPRELEELGNIARGVTHDGVIPLLQHGVLTMGRLYAVYPGRDGPTLAEVLKQGPLSATRAIAMFTDITRTLQTLHERGLSLGFLTPADVELVRAGTDQEAARIPCAQWGVGPGGRLGVSRFEAPELPQTGPTPAADQFTLGMLLIEALVGAAEGGAPGMGRTDVPKGLEDAVRRMVNPQPDKRFAHLGPVLKALRSAEGSAGASAESVPPPVPRNMETVRFEAIPQKQTPKTVVRWASESPSSTAKTPTPRPRPSEAHTLPMGLPVHTPEPAPLTTRVGRAPESSMPLFMGLFALAVAAVMVVLVLLQPEGTPPPVQPTLQEVVPAVAEVEEPATPSGTYAEEPQEFVLPATKPTPTTAVSVGLGRTPERPDSPPKPTLQAPVPEPEGTQSAEGEEAAPVEATEAEPTTSTPDPVPVEQPAPEPEPASFSPSQFDGVWRGQSLDIAAVFELRLSERGAVHGTLRLTDGLRVEDTTIIGTWARDGEGVQVDFQTDQDRPVRYIGVLSGDLGSGQVIERGKTRGSWSARF